MNQVWVDTTIPKIRKFIKRKIFFIFFFGCLVGGIITVFQWITKDYSNQASMRKWTTTMRADLELQKGVILSDSSCRELLKSEKVVDDLKQYMGGYEKYDSFEESFGLYIENGVLVMKCSASSRTEGEKILSKVSNELYGVLKDQKRLVSIKNKKFQHEEVKIDESEMSTLDKFKINLILGVVVMFIMYIIDFVLKDYISEAYEVSDYFNKKVLASIPIAYRKEKNDYENDRNKTVY